jgi:hypothetical protein
LEMSTVLRSVRGQAKRQPVLAPLAFELYNKHMGAVDRADALRSYLSVAAVTNKWWMAVFFWVLDVAAVNAWIMYVELKGLSDHEKATGRADFQDELVAGLALWTVDGQQPLALAVGGKRRRTSATAAGTAQAVRYSKKPFGKYNKAKPPACRLENVQHMQVEWNKYSNCVVCASLKERSQVQSGCAYCKCYLCPKHFKPFHSKRVPQ